MYGFIALKIWFLLENYTLSKKKFRKNIKFLIQVQVVLVQYLRFMKLKLKQKR